MSPLCPLDDDALPLEAANLKSKQARLPRAAPKLCVCVSACVYVCVCVRVRVCVCVCACLHNTCATRALKECAKGQGGRALLDNGPPPLPPPMPRPPQVEVALHQLRDPDAGPGLHQSSLESIARLAWSDDEARRPGRGKGWARRRAAPTAGSARPPAPPFPGPAPGERRGRLQGHHERGPPAAAARARARALARGPQSPPPPPPAGRLIRRRLPPQKPTAGPRGRRVGRRNPRHRRRHRRAPLGRRDRVQRVPRADGAGAGRLGGVPVEPVVRGVGGAGVWGSWGRGGDGPCGGCQEASMSSSRGPEPEGALCVGRREAGGRGTGGAVAPARSAAPSARALDASTLENHIRTRVAHLTHAKGTSPRPAPSRRWRAPCGASTAAPWCSSACCWRSSRWRWRTR
jgi:hypothetical protein